MSSPKKGSIAGTLAVTVVVLLVVYMLWSLVTASLGVNLYGCMAIVPAGNVGIVDSMGSVHDGVMQSGLNFKWPWEGVITYNVQRVPIDFVGADELITPTSDEAQVNVDATVWYHVDGTKAVQIYKGIGTDPAGSQLVKELRGIFRTAAARYTVEDLYTGGQRLNIEADTIAALNAKLNPLGIFVDDFQMRKTIPPQFIVDSLNAKIARANAIQTEQNQLEIEKIKAQQRVVDAQGIADSQRIIDNSLTPQYLQYLAIMQMYANAGNLTLITSGQDIGLNKIV